MQIGNADLNYETDTIGMYEYLASHALVSQETTARIMKHCNFSTKMEKQSDECTLAMNEANTMTDIIDQYNIYAPLCSNSSLTDKETTPLSFDPCTNKYVITYLNNPEVQKTLHANVTKIPYAWLPCRSKQIIIKILISLFS